MKKILPLFICFLLVGCQSQPDSPTPEIPVQNQEPSSTEDSIIQPPTTDESTELIPPTDEKPDSEPSQPDENITEEENSSKFIPSRLFFYDFEQDQMFYIDTDVEVFGGGYINALTHALKNDHYSDNLITMADETLVTSAKLDETTGILDVYFNETFYASTNLGSRAEVGFIDALVNTYGYNYNVKKVRILVEGKLFSDQRGEMPEGYFSVTSDTAISFE